MNPFLDQVGSWSGTNRFRLMPDDEFASGDSTAVSQAEAGGWGWSLRYTWIHPEDGAQSGLLLVASPSDDGSITAAWIDSWHQKPYLQAFSGAVVDGQVQVTAEYAPGWEWRIEAGPDAESDDLRMVMSNVVPADQGESAGAYVVMDATWNHQPPA